ncbi:MAG: hypothetical protein GY847_16925 [Proteobacteria bacterium]|nr:hypothetical protein [Pseudomonadota bacterium]
MNPTSPIQTNNSIKRTDEAKATVIGFTTGFLSLFRGFCFVYSEHRELARFYLPPMFLALVFLIGSWVLFALNIDDLINAFWSEPSPQAWWGIQHFFWQTLSILLWIILAVTTTVLTVAVFAVVAAPFSDFISERVEGILGTWTPRPFSLKFVLADLGQTIRLELTRLALKLAWLVPLFLLSLIIPAIGHFIYVFLGGYLLSKFIGMDYIDWCAARRGWTWKERLAFAKTHRFALAGLGTAVLLLLMIPLAFVFVWPAAVAAGAILFNSIYSEPSDKNPSR